MYKFDFFIPQLNIILELDGPQHFQQISNWQCPKITTNVDCYKMKWCLEQNISVIRILQEYILHDIIDWQSILQQYLHIYEQPCIYYIPYEKYSTHMVCMNLKS